MAVTSKKQDTIIIRKVKAGGHGHHGGAWKVAYADFVTAMMAFFLLLWLLNAASKEQLEGISEYFGPISTVAATAGGAGLLAGKTVSDSGVFEEDRKYTRTSPNQPVVEIQAPYTSVLNEKADGSGPPDEKQLEDYKRRKEEEQFKEAEKQLHAAIEDSPDLRGLAKSLIVDDTPEGLRIQIIDQEGLPMFPRGEAEMFAHTRQIIEMVAKVITKMPQDIEITGHTDATRYQNGTYSNWELSADRANAARRAFIQANVPADRITRVVGKAATDPLFPGDPEAPGNRRLSVVLLRGTGAKK